MTQYLFTVCHYPQLVERQALNYYVCRFNFLYFSLIVPNQLPDSKTFPALKATDRYNYSSF